MTAGSIVTLTPRAVRPTDLRWRDVLGQVYADSFRATFSYGRQVTVTLTSDPPHCQGTLVASGLKPNFAYQMKLVGRKRILSARRAPNARTDPHGWASWQLGRKGRWWCATENWNVTDRDLDQHLRAGHEVYGYLLFDFFLTDADGNAVKSFAVNSSYHVLWRTDQRTPTRADSAVLSHHVIRGLWGYGLTPPVTAGVVKLFAEAEPTRPRPGRVTLPAGPYPVWFNITEESFHDNLESSAPGGGFWAQVLQGAIPVADASDAAALDRP